MGEIGEASDVDNFAREVVEGAKFNPESIVESDNSVESALDIIKANLNADDIESVMTNMSSEALKGLDTNERQLLLMNLRELYVQSLAKPVGSKTAGDMVETMNLAKIITTLEAVQKFSQ